MKTFELARYGLLFALLVWTTLLLAQSADTAIFSPDSDFPEIAPITSGHFNHYEPVDRVPYFPGGQKDLIEYIQSSVQYPQIAQEYAIEGEVVLEFFLDESGKIQNPQVVKSPGFGLGKEALRIVQEMPEWEPAIVNGMPAASKKMCMAIMFRLR